MPRFRVSATELVDTDVNFVALVKRGANRIPFRITKSEEDDMIDLHTIGRRFFKTDTQPQVVAAIVEKRENLLNVVKTLKSVGIDVSAFVKSENGGHVTLTRKADLPPQDVAFVKMAGGVTLAISNLSKAFDEHDFQSPDFSEVHAKGTHMASLSNAADSLHRTMGNIMQNAKDPKDAAKQMGAACDAHKAYCSKLTSQLPQQAFKADQALLNAEVELIKAGDMRKHPHAGVALAIAHAAHAAASTAGQAADMLSQGGTDDDQQTGDGMGDQANGGKKTTMKSSSLGDNLSDEGDPGATDPLMPNKDPGQTSSVDAKKADAGKNGTGAGVELGEGTGTDDRATSDDASNNEVDAKPGARVSGDNSGMPAKAKAPTKKSAALLKAELKVAKLRLKLAKLGKADDDDDDDEIEDDDSTNGAQDDIPAKAKAPTALGGVNKVDGGGGPHTVDVTNEKVTGEGDEEGIFDGGGDADTLAAQARGTSDDAANSGGKVAGKVKGKTIDTSGIPAKAMSPTAAGGVNKNDGDADVGKKGQNPEQEQDETMSGSGAQQADAQTMKSEDRVMRAVQALAKSVQESVAAVTKSVEALNVRVETVATMAKKTDAALKGTVFADAGDDSTFRAQKSERSSAPPLLDTGYRRRTA